MPPKKKPALWNLKNSRGVLKATHQGFHAVKVQVWWKRVWIENYAKGIPGSKQSLQGV